MRLSDMRVGVKLGLAFAAMALLNLVLGGLAVVWLGHVNEDTREIANKWLPSVQALGDMRATANRLRASEIGAVLGSDPQLVPRLREDVAAVGRLLGEAEQRYAPMVAPSEAPLYAEFKNHRDAYLRAQARLMEMVADESRRAEAAHMLYGESQKTFINMAETIGKLSRASHEGSQAAYAESQQTFGSARGSVIAVLRLHLGGRDALGNGQQRDVGRAAIERHVGHHGVAGAQVDADRVARGPVRVAAGGGGHAAGVSARTSNSTFQRSLPPTGTASSSSVPMPVTRACRVTGTTSPGVRPSAGRWASISCSSTSSSGPQKSSTLPTASWRRMLEPKKRRRTGWPTTRPNSWASSATSVPSSMPKGARHRALMGGSMPGMAGMLLSTPT